MAKKKKIKETTIEDFYDLKIDKVDELVAALKGEDTSEFGDVSMKISDCTGTEGKGTEKNFNPYRTDFLSRIPAFLKALFVKWWAVLINPLFHFMETDRREYNDYMMFPFPFKAYWTFFTNVLYYIGVAVLVNFVYLFINEFMFTLHIEPMSWALIVLIVDMAFIGVKDLIVHLVKKRKKAVVPDV